LLHLLELLELLASAKRGQPIASGGYVCAADLTDANNVSKALSFMHAHLSEPITLDEVSEVLGVSPATSNRLFRRSLGKSFKEFLVYLRIAHACRLLAETEDSIIHVAQASGFGNLANFNRLFKSRKRKTPRDFRSGVQAEGTT
ncbi:MAG: AraC family transcriptional regulator, partial [Planctomycetota bacterium]